MQILKIIVELIMVFFVLMSIKKWKQIPKWERFAITLIFIALIMITIDQYRTYRASRQEDPQKHAAVALR